VTKIKNVKDFFLHLWFSVDVQRRTYPKSRVGGIGFVDALHSSTFNSSTQAGAHASTINGHAYLTSADDMVSGPGRGGNARYPHVVGYYEV